MTRGWTFQEGFLSKRLLVFTHYAMTYHCQRASWNEALQGPECIPFPRRVPWHNWPTCLFYEAFKPAEIVLNETSYDPLYKEYFQFVTQYSSRHLSKRSDRLNAFAGILAHMAKCVPKRQTIFGLPIIPHDSPDQSLEYHLFAALAWHTKNSPIVRLGQYPSWSWSGWYGHVTWFPGHQAHVFNSHRATFKIVAVMDLSVSGVIYPVDEFRRLLLLESIPTNIDALCIEVPFIPAANIIISADMTLLQDTLNIMDGEYWHILSDPLEDRVPEDLRKHLDDGTWSYCILGILQGNLLPNVAFLLLVEWIDGEKAQRLQSMPMRWYFPLYETLESLAARWPVRAMTLV